MTISLDPRAKLVVAAGYATIVMAGFTPLHLAAAAAPLLIAIVLMQQVRAYLRWLRMILPMAIFFGAVTAWSASVADGLAAGLKLLALTTTFFLFFVTTPPEDLANALIKAGLPYSIAFVMTTALQFVPVLGRKARQVMDAQRCRGIPMEPGWRAIRHYPAFLGPLLIQSFQLAEDLAEAMEARGFGRPGRTFFNRFALTGLDWAIMAVAIVTAAAVWMLRLMG